MSTFVTKAQIKSDVDCECPIIQFLSSPMERSDVSTKRCIDCLEGLYGPASAVAGDMARAEHWFSIEATSTTYNSVIKAYAEAQDTADRPDCSSSLHGRRIGEARNLSQRAADDGWCHASRRRICRGSLWHGTQPMYASADLAPFVLWDGAA